ncbi:TetR/AcrR family transcriptional regulator [Gandjariella thermophila]|uniref:TetR family transcriptional regulator n=1 Tax=Gandjariella thermophila TaxID=1931992 RepID=A0A4D4J7C9_9PSEU|nr:TetR/AcrR family transcriptional regulator [Gandjariella thermophila]GDY30910.1 TetR family transcriptional regulator [Gandjariella thermophila]
MAQATRRERPRSDTEREIRETARNLLVRHGREAVTLRAIARELGITAPALYRYYNSREDLLRQLCDDICLDVSGHLSADLAGIPEGDTTAQVFAVCRGFRRWALAHPHEFALVFASPEGSKAPPAGEAGECGPGPAHDQFGRVFLMVAGRVLITHEVRPPRPVAIPRALVADLEAFRDALLASLAEHGIEVPPERLGLDTVYFMLQFWVRLYGHVALEVFGRFPIAVSDPEPMFESMLTDLATQVGLQVP